MFTKVLVVEDFESSNISVQKALEDLKITNPKYVSYCDDAVNWIKKTNEENNPFELMITDLSFEEDHRPQVIKTGQQLIDVTRELLPDLKIIVFSVNKKKSITDDLFDKQNINGYVRKAREDVKDLKKAIKTVYKDGKYLSYDLKGKEKNAFEFSEYDILLITLLANGVFVKDIPNQLKAKDMKKSSMSTVEKRLKDIKLSLNINTNEQLIAFCKDFGVI